MAGTVRRAGAQSATITYTLQDVWLDPDISHPWLSPEQMIGTFEWTFTPGDFENGSGQFLELGIPWYGIDFGALDIIFDVGSIEMTLPGNWHDTGLDLTLFLSPPLSPDQPAPVDTTRSRFDIQQSGISYQGHVISGQIVPTCVPPANYGAGSPGSGGITPAITSSGGFPSIGNSAFQLDGARILGGASAFVLVGFGRDQVDFRGVDILVSPLGWFLFPVTATGPSGVPGAGTVPFPFPIPLEPLAIGIEVDAQILVLDAGGPSGVAAATDGLAMIICAG